MDFQKWLYNKKICLIDSTTTYTVLHNKIYLINLSLIKAKVNTILGPADLIEVSKRVMFILVNGMKLRIHTLCIHLNLEENF